MSVRHLTVAGAATAAWVAVGLASPAAAVCDAYSGGCPSTPPTAGPGGGSIGGGNQNPGSGSEQPGASGGSTDGTTSNPSTLPFTGGELVLMTAIGASALAGGTVLVIAGRRRGQSPA